MIVAKKIDLIDREELLEVLWRSSCSLDVKERITEIIDSRPVVAMAKVKYELELVEV